MSEVEQVRGYLESVNGQHRFHRVLWRIALHYLIFKQARSTINESWGEGEPAYLRCNATDFDLRSYPYDSYKLAEQGMWPERIVWDLVDRKYERKVLNIGDAITPTALSTQITQSLFAVGVEPAQDWMASVQGDRSKWPPVISFCRVVRNAIAHDGKVQFSNLNAKAEIWRGLTYSPADNGRDIRVDLRSADLITLIFDLENELNSINAPKAFEQGTAT